MMSGFGNRLHLDLQRINRGFFGKARSTSKTIQHNVEGAFLLANVDYPSKRSRKNILISRYDGGEWFPAHHRLTHLDDCLLEPSIVRMCRSTHVEGLEYGCPFAQQVPKLLA